MKKRMTLLILAAVMLLSLLCGCDSLVDEDTFKDLSQNLTGLSAEDFEALNEENNVELVIIAGKHANSNFPTAEDLLNNSTVTKLLERTYEYSYDDAMKKFEIEARVHIIVADGDPTQTVLTDDQGNELVLTVSNNNSVSAGNAAADFPSQIINAVCSDSLKANDTEVDLAAALLEATTIFNNKTAPGKEKHILIIDSGLCTTGYLNMNQLNIQDGTPDDVLSGISPGGKVDLAGIQITFLNLGNFAGPQMNMKSDAVFHRQFENFWTAYLADCNATVNKINFSSTNGMELSSMDAGYPNVSEVTFLRSPESFSLRPATAPFDPELDGDLVYNEETIGFGGDEYTFDDNAKALAVAQNIKTFYDKMVIQYPDVKLYVVGSVAGTNNENSDVSKKRASAVIEKLIEAGIPSEALVPVNAGTTELPWRNTVEVNYPDGTNNKAKNRVVAVIPSYRTTIVDTLRNALGDRFPD